MAASSRTAKTAFDTATPSDAPPPQIDAAGMIACNIRYILSEDYGLAGPIVRINFDDTDQVYVLQISCETPLDRRAVEAFMTIDDAMDMAVADTNAQNTAISRPRNLEICRP